MKDSASMRPITHPTALRDQYDAALADAHQLLTDLAAHIGAPLTPGPTPPWLTGHLSALQDALHDGRALGCHHLDGGPAVAMTTVWTPGILACLTCAPTLLRPTPAEDLRCDRCRHTTIHLHAGMVGAHLTIGPVLLAYGLCTPCRTQLATQTTTPATTNPTDDAGRAHRQRDRSRPDRRRGGARRAGSRSRRRR